MDEVEAQYVASVLHTHDRVAHEKRNPNIWGKEPGVAADEASQTSNLMPGQRVAQVLIKNVKDRSAKNSLEFRCQI